MDRILWTLLGYPDPVRWRGLVKLFVFSICFIGLIVFSMHAAYGVPFGIDDLIVGVIATAAAFVGAVIGDALLRRRLGG